MTQIADYRAKRTGQKGGATRQTQPTDVHSDDKNNNRGDDYKDDVDHEVAEASDYSEDDNSSAGMSTGPDADTRSDTGLSTDEGMGAYSKDDTDEKTGHISSDSDSEGGGSDHDDSSCCRGRASGASEREEDALLTAALANEDKRTAQAKRGTLPQSSMGLRLLKTRKRLKTRQRHRRAAEIIEARRERNLTKRRRRYLNLIRGRQKGGGGGGAGGAGDTVMAETTLRRCGPSLVSGCVRCSSRIRRTQ